MEAVVCNHCKNESKNIWENYLKDKNSTNYWVALLKMEDVHREKHKSFGSFLYTCYHPECGSVFNQTTHRNNHNNCNHKSQKYKGARIPAKIDKLFENKKHSRISDTYLGSGSKNPEETRNKKQKKEREAEKNVKDKQSSITTNLTENLLLINSPNQVIQRFSSSTRIYRKTNLGIY